MNYINYFEQITINDIGLVGGKNAALGQMIQDLMGHNDIRIPTGFAITSDAYWHFLDHNGLNDTIRSLLATVVDTNDMQALQQASQQLRLLFNQGTIPADLEQQITIAYQQLCTTYHQKVIDVAVRSSATAEDLPGASFAGQQDTYLNIRGIDQVLLYFKECMGSLFTPRAIIYRIEKNFDHMKIAMSVGIQKMIRSDKACSGVAFSLDTETGFKDIVLINASYGLGELIVKGEVNPDEYRVFKPLLQKGYTPIIKKMVGDKSEQLLYGTDNATVVTKVPVPKDLQGKFCLTDQQIILLAQQVVTIEQRFSAIHGQWTPMDIEWAVDGIDGQLYIVQARPETIYGLQSSPVELVVYHCKQSPTQLEKLFITAGQSVGSSVASGTARIIMSMQDIGMEFNAGDILVTDMTDPDWLPLIKKAGAIITNRGGRTCHAAIVSRELAIPAIVGTGNATETITHGQTITIDCSQGQRGMVYNGIINYTKEIINTKNLEEPKIPLLVNIADPDHGYNASQLPWCSGVGLVRIEFIMANNIQVHPMALACPEKIEDTKIREKITALTQAYSSSPSFFVDTLAQGIATIASYFYPRNVIVRFSDFKSNEYRNLLGGFLFEPQEENPMLGLRGASRYSNVLYEPAFILECQAIKKVYESMGFDNIRVMIPFVRTIQEAKTVINRIREIVGSIKIFMMVEIPANVIEMEDYIPLFDGFSLGSNDLTQLTLGVDRDSGILAPVFDERNNAVQSLMMRAITTAKKHNHYIGICGQAPSDYPEIAHRLIDAGISSLSLNYDAYLNVLLDLNKNSNKS